MHDWWFGTKNDNAVSMGVTSSGNIYGVPDNLIFSFPLNITPEGNW